jgi:hypothetical protein
MTEDRSHSRGRDALLSTGRGGIGNIRQSSLSRDTGPSPEDYSPNRGRETVAIYSTGRGGAGNLRSPSRDPNRGPDPVEREVLDNYVTSHDNVPLSSGRGGLGNINRSRSRDPTADRSRSRDPARISTGRGGVGNIRPGEDGYDANIADEVERKKHETGGHELHSTGRGGFANITEQDEPALERPSFSTSAIGSTGRGGAGNIRA